jgi:DNA helicase-2/ATP-dependent DNA helicase PcrA
VPSPSSVAVIACAGGRKTQQIIDAASAAAPQRALITTYTDANQRQIVRRLQDRAGGVVPQHISVQGWFSFLINECARPYQRVITERPNALRSLNFKGKRNRYVGRAAGVAYYCDTKLDLYRNSVSEFVCDANKRSGGAVVRRLERNFRFVFVDEVQDLAGYDLEFLRLLLSSSITVKVVGDPRQNTLATNTSRKNKALRGQRLVDWLREQERAGLCEVVDLNESFRCNQEIWPSPTPRASLFGAT